MNKSEKIGQLNDATRKNLGCNVIVTCWVYEFRHCDEIYNAVREYSNFTKDNDPFWERDFGAFEVDGVKLFWKIDYYDLSMKQASPDPADENVTKRILTIMLAEEY